MLGHAPILGVLSVYYNNQKFNCPIRSASGTVSSGAMTFTPAGLVAGVVAVTVSETYSQTFNDYGGDGSRGTWERPLWNQAFAEPGNIDPTTAFTARDPYSFAWNGIDPTITVPTALNGKTVTVYYATPQILKSNGGFYNRPTTPLQLLNMEFEFACGNGSEYGTRFAAQQIINNFCSGAGSVRLDLTAANAVQNYNFEVIGAFTCWPNGDCDVADVITDICMSGPVLLGAN